MSDSNGAGHALKPARGQGAAAGTHDSWYDRTFARVVSSIPMGISIDELWTMSEQALVAAYTDAHTTPPDELQRMNLSTVDAPFSRGVSAPAEAHKSTGTTR